MSANCWSQCPRCRKAHKETVVKAEKQHADHYGQLTAEEWEKEGQALRKLIKEELRDTLRENWDLGHDGEGGFYVDYCAECQSCGLTFEYSYQSPIPLE